MINNILITGSGGMLGTELLNQFKTHKNHEIFALTSQYERLRQEFVNYSNINIIQSIEDLPNDIAFSVINCAFPRTSNGKTLVQAMDNTEKMIHILSGKKVKKIINISSQSVYTQQKVDIPDENYPVDPDNLYGLAKYSVERITELTCRSLNIKYLNVRLGSLTSPKFEMRMINRFINNIYKQTPITIDSGSPRVSFLHIEDAAKALIKIVNHKKDPAFTVYNLGNNDSMSLEKLVEKCNEIANKKGLVPVKIIKNKKESHYNNTLNNNRIINEFLWEPDYTLEDIIEESLHTH